MHRMLRQAKWELHFATTASVENNKIKKGKLR